MKRTYFVFRVLALQAVLVSMLAFQSAGMGTQVQADEGYSFLLNQVSVKRIMDNVEKLSGFGTRFTPTKECNASAKFLYSYFSGLGSYNVSFRYFTVQPWNCTGMNVVASKSRDGQSSQVVILCAHYDSISDEPYSSAPGAEDNAAGVAVLMEVTRVVGGYNLDRTVMFVAFSAEEEWMQGSKAWVSENLDTLNSTVGVICLDGVGRGETVAVMHKSSGSASLAKYVHSVSGELGYGNFYVQRVGWVGSDSDSFEDVGVKAVRLWDWDDTYIHTASDIPQTLNPELVKQVAEVTLAAFYKLSTRPLDEIFPPEGEPSDNILPTLLVGVAVAVSTAFMLLRYKSRLFLGRRAGLLTGYR